MNVTKWLTFNDHQAATIEAAMARIIPTDETPGAYEAGTINWLDRYLSGVGYIHAKPDGSGFKELPLREQRAWLPRIEYMRRTYAKGVQQLDELSQTFHGGLFISIGEPLQDDVLTTVENRAKEIPSGSQKTIAERDNVDSFNEASASFFELLVVHTRQAFYSDPIYGGNADRVGWQTIGFVGPDSLADVQAGNYTTLPYFSNNADSTNTGREVG